MTDAAATLIDRTLLRAEAPASVIHADAVVRKAVELFAENLSVRGKAELADQLGGDLAGRITAIADKTEHEPDALVELLAERAGISATVADDLLGAMYEGFWEILDRGQIDAMIAQIPPALARELMAAIPGESRGKF